MTQSIRRFAGTVACGLIVTVAGLGSARASEPNYTLQHDWWQWAMSIPSASNPILDNSGARCAFGQRGNLWFLAGNTGGRTTRECTIPAGTRVLIPVHNTFCFPDASFTEQQCFEAVRDDFDSFTVARATLDDMPLALDEFPAIPGDYWTFVVPRNGLFGTKPGLYRATVAAGRWAFANFPAAGIFTLRIEAKNTAGFELDVTYKLTVAEVQ
jgi:hypothetical protein